jgi:hypothetical protein
MLTTSRALFGAKSHCIKQLKQRNGTDAGRNESPNQTSQSGWVTPFVSAGPSNAKQNSSNLALSP